MSVDTATNTMSMLGLVEVDGKGHPPGPWIKCKGSGNADNIKGLDMTENVIPFPSSPKQADGEVIAFANPAHTEVLLRESLAWNDPTLMIRSVVGVARMLLDETWTDSAAVSRGWPNLAAARARALDLLTIVATLPAPPGESSK